MARGTPRWIDLGDYTSCTIIRDTASPTQAGQRSMVLTMAREGGSCHLGWVTY